MVKIYDTRIGELKAMSLLLCNSFTLELVRPTQRWRKRVENPRAHSTTGMWQ